MMLQLSSVLRIWLAYGIEFHWLREDVEVVMHDLRRHANDCTARHDVAVECGTRFWDEGGGSTRSRRRRDGELLLYRRSRVERSLLEDVVRRERRARRLAR